MCITDMSQPSWARYKATWDEAGLSQIVYGDLIGLMLRIADDVVVDILWMPLATNRWKVSVARNDVAAAH